MEDGEKCNTNLIQEQDDFEDEEYVYVNEDEKRKQAKKAAPVKARPKSTRGKKTRDSDEDVDMSEENEEIEENKVEEVAPKKRKTMEVNSQTRKRARKALVEEIEPAVPEKPIQRSKSKRLIVEEDEEMKPIPEPKVEPIPEPKVEPPKRKGRLLPTSFSASGTKKKKAVRQSTLNFTPSQR